MKLSKAILSIVTVTYVLLQLAACGDDNPTAQEIRLKKLQAKTWNVQSVKIDGVDYTTMFTGMTLAIGKNSFSSTNGGMVWPASGTWEFADEQATTIMRGDQIPIVIQSLTENELVLSLPWNKTLFGPGRAKSLSGNHVFVFH